MNTSRSVRCSEQKLRVAFDVLEPEFIHVIAVSQPRRTDFRSAANRSLGSDVRGGAVAFCVGSAHSCRSVLFQHGHGNSSANWPRIW
jgi:hypothetical protein